MSLYWLLTLPPEAFLVALFLPIILASFTLGYLRLKSRGKPRLLLEAVVIAPEAVYHRRFRLDDLENRTIEVNGLDYQVAKNQLYRVQRGLIRRVIDWLDHIEARYLIVYREGEVSPVVPARPKVGSRVLAKVRTSSVLGRALREMFRQQLEARGFIVFLGMAIIIALVVLRRMGYV